MGDALTRPDCELQTSLQVKEGYGPVLKLCANNAFRLEPKAVPIESERLLQIINANSDNGDSWLHVDSNLIPLLLLVRSDAPWRDAARSPGCAPPATLPTPPETQCSSFLCSSVSGTSADGFLPFRCRSPP